MSAWAAPKIDLLTRAASTFTARTGSSAQWGRPSVQQPSQMDCFWRAARVLSPATFAFRLQGLQSLTSFPRNPSCFEEGHSLLMSRCFLQFLPLRLTNWALSQNVYAYICVYIYVYIYIYTLGAGGSPGTPAPRGFIYMKLGWGWGGVGWGW